MQVKGWGMGLLGKDAPLDLDRLIETRLLIQANSGGGKSWAIRRLLEQTHGRVQQIVLDVEGEFHTLREKHDYVLARPRDGDCVAHPKTAALLAEKALELGVSLIADIYELKAHERLAFARLFLSAIVNAPKRLWHPVLIIIDEAHIFAPQVTGAESGGAVIDLMTRGRKRGYCGVLATQRLSKLHKDAAAEAHNKVIGLTTLDVDRKRAGDELGFTTKEDVISLRNLEPGQFYAFGPALAKGVNLIRFGAVETTHPRPGQRAMAAPPPSEKVKAALAKLTDLPKEAEEEQRTNETLRRDLAEARRKLTMAEKGAPAIDPKTIEAAREDGRRAGWDQGAETMKRIAVGALGGVASNAEAALAEFQRQAVAALPLPHGFAKIDVRPADRFYRESPKPVRPRTNGAHHGQPMGKGERKILIAIAQYPEGVDREQLTILTGYKRSSRDTYLQRLRAAGYIEDGETISATQEGVDALGNFDPLPTGDALRDYWLQRLGGGEREILRVVIESYPDAVDREVISESTTYKRSSRDTYLQRLGARKLIVSTRDGIRASEALFG